MSVRSLNCKILTSQPADADGKRSWVNSRQARNTHTHTHIHTHTYSPRSNDKPSKTLLSIASSSFPPRSLPAKTPSSLLSERDEQTQKIYTERAALTG